MGLCLSKQKTENYTSVGGSGSSKMVSGDGTQFSKSSSKASISSSFPPTPRTEGEILQSSNVKSFSFNDLKAATGNFRTDSVLGEGGFGCVFKGCIDEHTLRPSKPGSQSSMVVAVKRLKQDGWQGHREWLAEINYLGQLQHPNLVKLIGYCLENDQRLLVYEFMQRGSLDNHLFRRGSYYQPLSWSRRMKIALGAARGLAFLHGTDSKVIYRDFKTSNILLDSNYNAKLSDFGLARDGPDDNKTHVTTRIMGTYGYAAPEYLCTGHLTAKSDVYSFGVVLLEILSGKGAIDKYRPAGEHNLVEWARPYLTNKRRVLTVIDARLEGQYSVSVVAKVAILALQCLSVDPRIRPNMEDAINMLEKLQDTSKSQSKQGNVRVERTSLNHNERQNVAFMAYPRPIDY